VVTLPTLPNLDGLIGLARQDGVDVRPTLVRVLTDLYVQKRAHTTEEEHRYTELALWLLAGVDVATRAAVAKKLAAYPQAPRLVIRRLARDVIEVAEPVLMASSCLTSDDLLAVIKDFGPRHAAVIGSRHLSAVPATDRAASSAVTGKPPATNGAKDVWAEDGRGVGELAERLVSPADRSEVPVQDHPSIAGAPPAVRDGEAVNLGERFLNAGAPERRLLLERLEDEAPREAVLPAGREDLIRELEDAAMRRRPDDFARSLDRALRISAPRDRSSTTTAASRS
jgi:hypothetical protein